MGGILFARHFQITLSVQIIALILFVFLAGLALFSPLIRQGQKAKMPGIYIFLLIGFFIFSQLRYTLSWSYYPQTDIVHVAQAQSQLAGLRGTVISKPYTIKSKDTFAPYNFRHEAKTLFTLKCSQMHTTTGWQDVSGRVAVIVKKPALHVEFGDKVEIDGWRRRRSGPTNPGEPDFRDHYHAERELVQLSVGYGEAVRILDSPDAIVTKLAQWRMKIQDVAHGALLGDQTDNDKQVSAFLSALLLGNRQGLYDGQLSDVFIRSGSLHFLSISGLHLGILVGFIWWMGWILQWPRWLQGSTIILFVTLFLLVVPLRAPVVRAGIMCLVFCIGFLNRRKSHAFNLLALAAIMILLIRPTELFQAGFQLSFVVVAGLILFAPLVYNFKFFKQSEHPLDRVRKYYRRPKTWWAKLFYRFLLSIWGLATVALIAWLVGMPLAAWHFNRIAPWGAIASVLLFLPIALLLILGFGKMCLAFILPGFSVYLSGLLDWLSEMTIGLANVLANLPGNQIYTAAMPLWFIGLFYLLISGNGYRVLRGKKVSFLWTGGLMIWLIVFCWLVPFRDITPDQSRFTVLNVGHGTAVIGELPDDQVICYDAGSMSRANIGYSIVVPFMRSRGISHIDALFISHANLDHYSAVPYLAQNIDAKTVYASKHIYSKIERKNEKSATALLLREIETTHSSMQTLRQNDWLDSAKDHSYKISVLWPPETFEHAALSINDSSLVLHIALPGGSILLAGDIGDVPQQWLMEHKDREMKADVLLLPHHGSINRHLAEFVDTVDPQYIINSCGFLNPQKVQHLQNELGGRNIYHTFESGAIEVSFLPNNITIKTFNDGLRTVDAADRN